VGSLPLIFALEICYKETLPLYPPPLIREGEDIEKRGFAPLKHPLFSLPRFSFAEGY